MQVIGSIAQFYYRYLDTHMTSMRVPTVPHTSCYHEIVIHGGGRLLELVGTPLQEFLLLTISWVVVERDLSYNPEMVVVRRFKAFTKRNRRSERVEVRCSGFQFVFFLWQDRDSMAANPLVDRSFADDVPSRISTILQTKTGYRKLKWRNKENNDSTKTGYL